MYDLNSFKFYDYGVIWWCSITCSSLSYFAAKKKMTAVWVCVCILAAVVSIAAVIFGCLGVLIATAQLPLGMYESWWLLAFISHLYCELSMMPNFLKTHLLSKI